MKMLRVLPRCLILVAAIVEGVAQAAETAETPSQVETYSVPVTTKVGYDAYWDGVAIEGNPYDQETEPETFLSWINGWREARKHDYDESEG